MIRMDAVSILYQMSMKTFPFSFLLLLKVYFTRIRQTVRDGIKCLTLSLPIVRRVCGNIQSKY